MAQRQQRRCHNENNDYLLGTKGRGDIARGIFIENAKGRWRYEGKRENMYQVEHNELFKSIRDGEPINNGERMALSTRTASRAGRLPTPARRSPTSRPQLRRIAIRKT